MAERAFSGLISWEFSNKCQMDDVANWNQQLPICQYLVTANNVNQVMNKSYSVPQDLATNSTTNQCKIFSNFI